MNATARRAGTRVGLTHDEALGWIERESKKHQGVHAHGFMHGVKHRLCGMDWNPRLQRWEHNTNQGLVDSCSLSKLLAMARSSTDG